MANKIIFIALFASRAAFGNVLWQSQTETLEAFSPSSPVSDADSYSYSTDRAIRLACRFEVGPNFGVNETGLICRKVNEAWAGGNNSISSSALVIRAPAILFETGPDGTLPWAGMTPKGLFWVGTPNANTCPGNPRLCYLPKSQFEVIGGVGIGSYVAGNHRAGDGDLWMGGESGKLGVGTTSNFSKANVYGDISTAECAGCGEIKRSSNGYCWKETVGDNGDRIVSAVHAPEIKCP